MAQKFACIDLERIDANCLFLDSFFNRLFLGKDEGIRDAKASNPIVDAAVGMPGFSCEMAGH